MRAARTLFRDPGYDNTSVHDLAREADISVSTLYKVFPNKAAIAGALFGELFASIAEWAERANGDPLADLEEFGRRLATLAHREYDYTTALLQAVQTSTIASRGTGPDLHPNDPRVLAPLPRPAAKLIARCQHSKQMRGDYPARELAAVYVNTLMLRVMTRRSDGPRQIIRIVNDVLLEGMARRSRSDPVARARRNR